MAGWDNFSEPLNYDKSKISWFVNPEKHRLDVTYTLVGATPTKLYQVAINIFCTTFPATFGNFPVAGGGGACGALTRQGATKTLIVVELGTVLTDIHGDGTFTLAFGPIAAGTYEVEFAANDGAGCFVIGGGGDATCPVDFQSPGPTFGDTTTIIIP
jgi:hypothetical protein